MSRKGPVLPKLPEALGRLPGEAGEQVLQKTEELEKRDLGVYFPGTHTAIKMCLRAYNDSWKKAVEGFEKWNNAISPSDPSGAAPGPSGYRSYADESVDSLLYTMIKDRAVSEGYRFLEVSPEEMIEKYGYASDRKPADRCSGGGYKGMRDGKSLYVTVFDPRVAAHEYWHAALNTDNEDVVNEHVREDLKSLSRKLKTYSLN